MPPPPRSADPRRNTVDGQAYYQETPMNELWKTLIFVGVAAGLTGAAVVSTRDRSRADVEFNDQGQPFFPSFQNPLECTDLEVVDFDPSTATASRFRVMFKDKKWVIPSHYDY